MGSGGACNVCPQAPTDGTLGLMSFVHIKLWAAQELVAATFLLCSRQNFEKHYLPVFITAALLIMAAAAKKRTRLLKATVFARSLLRIAMMLQLSVRGETLNLIRYGDLPTYLMTFLPEMLILNWKFGAPLFMFAFSHAAVCALFFYMTNIHSLPMSIFRGFGVHAVCYCVFLAIRHSTNSHCKRASEALAHVPPKAIEQLQSDAQDKQQHKLHQRHEEQMPDKAQQQQQQQQQQHEEMAGRCLSERHPGDVSQSAPPLSMRKVPGPAGQHCASGSAAAGANAIATANAGDNNCDPGTGGAPQPWCLGGLQSGPAQQQRLLKMQGCGAPGSVSGSIGSKPWSHPSGSAPISASSVSKSSISLGSIGSMPTSQQLYPIPPPTPFVPKGVADALRSGAEVPGQGPYVSKRSRPHSSAKNTGMARHHPRSAACRVAVKVAGSCHPDDMPAETTKQLQDCFARSQWVPTGSPAVREGCTVISYGVVPRIQDCTLPEMRNRLAALAKEWAHQHGLLSTGEEGQLTVQACCQSFWGSISTNLGLDCPPEHSILVRQPFLETIASGPDQEAYCAFNLTLVVPNQNFKLRGWQGAADAPEELPEDVKSQSLCLLASLDGGHFLKTSAEQHSDGSDGELSARVRVSLPNESMRDDLATPHPKVLVLELWAAGGLACSYAAVVLPRSSSGALAELRSWVGQAEVSEEESSAFVCDLVEWMHFRATCSNALEGKQVLEGIGDSADQADEEVQEMLEVGKDLLLHSLRQGMGTLAGMLLNGLASRPFSTPPSNLLDPCPAEQPEAVQQLQDACKEGCLPSSSALVQQPPSPNVASSASAACSQPSRPAAGDTAGCPNPSVLSSSASTSAPSAATAASSAIACVFSESRQEEEYQAWKSTQIAPMAIFWCKIKVLFVVAGVLKRWLTIKGLEGKAAALADVVPLAPMVTAYAIGAIFIGRESSYTELILASMIASRSCFGILVGFGFLPMPAMLLPIMKFRVDVLVEIFMISVVEQVRFLWMFPLRLVLTVGQGLYYSSIGCIVAPWSQAILLNACCLAVAKVVDIRYRRLHALALSNARQKKGNVCDQRHDEVPGCGHGKVLHLKA